jgi:predicted phage terminase large subunit-like protein
VPAILDDAKIAATLGKQVGESLWPERFSLEHLESARSLNPTGFSALYQGRPTPPEGSFFKNTDIHTYTRDKLPTRGNKYMTGDLALSVERDRDHSCVGNWVLDENDDLYLLPDLYWEQKSADESVDTIVENIKEHQPLVAWWERGQIAKAVGPFLEKRMMEERSFTNIEALPSAASKAAKCTSIRGRMRQGKVFFPSFAPWWPRAKEQLLKFTGSGDDKADDFCDMCGLIGQGLGDQIRIGSPKAAPGNVINIGSMKWVKWAHDQERRAENRRKALKGW